MGKACDRLEHAHTRPAVMTSSHFCHPSQCLEMRLILNLFTFLKKIYTEDSPKKIVRIGNSINKNECENMSLLT